MDVFQLQASVTIDTTEAASKLDALIEKADKLNDKLSEKKTVESPEEKGGSPSSDGKSSSDSSGSSSSSDSKSSNDDGKDIVDELTDDAVKLTTAQKVMNALKYGKAAQWMGTVGADFMGMSGSMLGGVLYDRIINETNFGRSLRGQQSWSDTFGTYGAYFDKTFSQENLNETSQSWKDFWTYRMAESAHMDYGTAFAMQNVMDLLSGGASVIDPTTGKKVTPSYNISELLFGSPESRGSSGSRGFGDVEDGIELEGEIDVVTSAADVAEQVGPVTLPVNLSVSGIGGKGPLNPSLPFPSSMLGGSHAKGLTYAPYDGYLAELHRGEEIITREQSDVNRNRGTSTNTNNNLYVQNMNMSGDADADMLMAKMASMSRSSRYGRGS